MSLGQCMMSCHSSCNRSHDLAVDPPLAYSAAKYMHVSAWLHVCCTGWSLATKRVDIPSQLSF